MQPQLLTLLCEGLLSQDDLDSIVRLEDLSTLPDVLEMLDVVGALDKARAELEAAVESKSLGAVKAALAKALQVGLSRAPLLDQAQACASALQLEQATGEALLAPESGLLADVLGLLEEQVGQEWGGERTKSCPVV
jgi:hypothetical protein